jgi:hypothetical protein
MPFVEWAVRLYGNTFGLYLVHQVPLLDSRMKTKRVEWRRKKKVKRGDDE